MPTVGVVNGSLLRLKIGAANVLKATNCKFSHKTETRETASKDDVGDSKTYDYAGFSATLSSDFLFVEGAGGFSGLIASQIAKTKVAWIFGTGVTGDVKLSGNAIIESLEVDAPDKQNSTGSLNLLVDGAVTVGTFE